ncbi:MAG: 1,4-alpha-glucan branching protein domain-containing protein [Candidatus Binatia bacterium]
MMLSSVGSFALVLHAHQPFVLGHGRWPHGSDWLCEAVVESYLPILRILRAPASVREVLPLTLSFSPVLCEQLASPLFQPELQTFLDHRLRACAETDAHFRQHNQTELAAVANYWAGVYRAAVSLLQEIDGNVLGAFRQLMEEQRVSLITSAATHGYLPLLGKEESVALQMRLAVQTHERHFGRRPRGAWLPECGYRPRYQWIPPVGGDRQSLRAVRRGLEEVLADNGLEFFFADSHLIVGGRPSPPYSEYFPQLDRLREVGRDEWPRRPHISPHSVCTVTSPGGEGTARAFFRNLETARQVWSRERGYPGDPWYLDFYKKHEPQGLQLWRVSDKGAFDAKSVYAPTRAQEQAREHAHHFAGLVAELLRQHSTPLAPALVCSLFDAELFGHWWHEGPHWLSFLQEELMTHGVQSTTCPTYLDRQPPGEPVTLPEGSWGEGGDHRTWLNNETGWAWERLYDSETEFWEFLHGCSATAQAPLRRVLTQACRELLLMQASDWPFLMTAGTARDYADQRFSSHFADFKQLMLIARNVREHNQWGQEEWMFLASKEQQNFLFPALEQILFT